MPRTRPVEKAKAADYLHRAEELGRAMRHSLLNDSPNAAMIEAVHCAIAAVDAMCVHDLGERHAGESHEGALALLHDVKRAGVETAERQFSRLLGLKSDAAYGEKLFTEKQAYEAVRDAERLLSLARSMVKS